MITIIVACDPNGVIGKDNTIPWHLPADLKLFRETTLGSSILMGRHTWDSLPKKPLKGRINYVISRKGARPTLHYCLEDSLAGPIWCSSLEDAVKDAQKNEKPIFIIGGESIYELALKSGMVGRVLMSRLHAKYDGDRFFHLPLEGWKLAERSFYEGFDLLNFVRN